MFTSPHDLVMSLLEMEPGMTLEEIMDPEALELFPGAHFPTVMENLLDKRRAVAMHFSYKGKITTRYFPASTHVVL